MPLNLLAYEAIIPSLVLLAYAAVRLRVSVMREVLWAGFLGGIAAAFAATFWQQAVTWLVLAQRPDPLYSALAHAFLVRAIPEEGLKFGLLMAMVLRVIHLADARDTVFASLGIALGFAAIGAATTAAGLSFGGFPISGPAAMLSMMSLTAEHGLCGLAMGALVARVNDGPIVSGVRFLPALLVPILLRAAYDFPLSVFAQDPNIAWPPRVIPLLMVASLIIACTLLGSVVRRGKPDRREQMRTRPRARRAALFGILLIMGGLVFAVAGLGQYDRGMRDKLALFCLVPMALGVDLMMTAVAIVVARRPVVAREEAV